MTVAETLARLERLYYEATPATIADAFDEAIDLLKTLPSETDRERAAVYMEGLAEMKREFAGRSGPKRSGNPPRRPDEAAPKRRPR
jgi:hypothetical protein